jgi:hypothetical protein
MSKIGYGYGSEWHLLRYLGYHRHALNAAVLKATEGRAIDWLDWHFKAGGFLDAEWKGLDFLPEGNPAREAWKKFWPRTGNVPNWDAVARLKGGDGQEKWLLVEAKAYRDELLSRCKADKDNERSGWKKIEAAFLEAKSAFGVAPERDWLDPYYQYCNRLTILHFLHKHDIPARLLFIYFCGDRHPKSHWLCPKDEDEWATHLDALRAHVGLTDRSLLERRIHRIVLPVCG